MPVERAQFIEIIRRIWTEDGPISHEGELRPIVAPTDELAWERAHGILARTEKILADRPRVTGTPGDGASGPVGGSVGSARLRELAERGELHDRALWTPLAKSLGGSPILNPDSAPELARHAGR